MGCCPHTLEPWELDQRFPNEALQLRISKDFRRLRQIHLSILLSRPYRAPTYPAQLLTTSPRAPHRTKATRQPIMTPAAPAQQPHRTAYATFLLGCQHTFYSCAIAREISDIPHFKNLSVIAGHCPPCDPIRERPLV